MRVYILCESCSYKRICSLITPNPFMLFSGYISTTVDLKKLLLERFKSVTAKSIALHNGNMADT